jgi:hypothetical protein
MNKPIFTLILSSLFSLGFAQNWTVGIPVNSTIASFTAVAGSCAQGTADVNVTIPASLVTGVDYYLHLVLLSGSGGMDVMPNNVTMVDGDSIQINSQSLNLFLNTSAGGGFASLQIKAHGIPTTAGQAHPCSTFTNFVSNFQICPEGLTHGVTNTCTVDAATGLSDMTQASSQVFLSQNGWTYTSGEQSEVIQLFGIDGRLLFTSMVKAGERINLPIQESGIYLLRHGTNTQKIVQP